MWKKPAGYLVRIGAGVEGAMVGEHVAAQARDPAVLRGRELGGHVIVAGVGGRGQVLDPVLDPLHRPAEHDRADDGADIARIDADLVAEAAADVGAITCTLASRMPESSDTTVLTTCGAWKVP